MNVCGISRGIWLSLIIFVAPLFLLACSSGGDGTPSPGPSPPPGGTPPGGTPPGGTPPGGTPPGETPPGSTTPSAKSWTTPYELDTSNIDAYSPQLGYAGDGYALAVWIEQTTGTGSGQFLMWAEKPATSDTWSVPQPVYSGSDQPVVTGKSSEIYNPPVTLKVAADGSAWISWIAYDIQNSNNYVYVSNFNAGGWSTPKALNIDQTYKYHVRNVNLGMNSAGKVAVAWSELDNKPQGSGGANTLYGNYVSVYQAASQSWSTPEKLDPAYEIEFNRTDDNKRLLNTVLISETGEVTVLFSTRATTGSEVWANSNVNATGWGSSTPVSAEPGADSQRAVIDSNGDIHVTWIQFNAINSIYNIAYSKRDHVSGTWTAPDFVETGATKAVSQALDVNTNNLLAVVWAKVSPTLGTTYSDIYSAQRAAGASTWTQELVVESQAQMSQPEVAVDNNNNMMVLWDVLRGHNWYRYWGDGAWTSDGAKRVAAGYNNKLVKDNNDVIHAIWGEDNALGDANGARTSTFQ